MMRTVSSFFFLPWALLYSKLLYAAATGLPPLSADVYGFDFESLAWAAAAAVLGGVLRTIFSLASEKVHVGSIWREGLKDAVIAMVGGVVVYIIVQWAATVWPTWFTSQARLLLITGAGFSRGRWSNVLGDVVSDALGNLRNRIRGGGDLPPPPPASVIGPLENPK